MARFRSTEHRDGLPTGDSGHLEALKVEHEEAAGLECVLRVTGRERRETGSEVKELYLVWKKPEYVFHAKRGSQEDSRSSRQRNRDKHANRGGRTALRWEGLLKVDPWEAFSTSVSAEKSTGSQAGGQSNL